jgi:hypothetical protein
MEKYQQALKDFGRIEFLTYFEPSQHTRIADLCYLALHELDLHAEGEYWHTASDRRNLLKFCQKWGSQAEDGIDYVAESQLQFDLGKQHRRPS